MAEAVPAQVAPGAPVKAVQLRLAPLLAPYRSKGRLTIRIERVPQKARLTRGRNNGDGSWSLTLDEAEGSLEYIGPDSALERPSLAVRVIDLEIGGATLAMLELKVHANEAETISRESPDEEDEYLAELAAELKSARAALVEREQEIARLRNASDTVSATEAEIARRLAAADAAAKAAAALAAEQAQKLARTAEAERLAAEARWNETSARALADAEARATAKLVQAEQAWQQQLADAEARWRRERDAAAAGGGAREAEAARLRDKLTAAENLIRRRDDDLARLRNEVAEAQKRAEGDVAAAIARAESQWKEAQARRLADAEAQWRKTASEEAGALAARGEAAERKLAETEKAVAAHDASLRRLRDENAGLREQLETATKTQPKAMRSQIDAALARAEAQWKDAEARRLAEVEAQWRKTAADEARALAARGEAAERKLAETEKALAAQDVTLRRLREQLDTAAKEQPKATRSQIDAALARAEAQWKDAEARRLADAEAQWRRTASEEARALAARGETAERKLAETEKAVAAHDVSLRRLRDENAGLRDQLETAAKTQPKAMRSQIDAALAQAEAQWKDAEARRLADAEAQWRKTASEEARALAARGEAAERKLAETEKSVAAQDVTLRRLRDEMSGLRDQLDSATKVQPDAVRGQIDAALASARSAWAAEEESRLHAAEAAWRAGADEERAALIARRDAEERALSENKASADAEILRLREEKAALETQLAQAQQSPPPAADIQPQIDAALAPLREENAALQARLAAAEQPAAPPPVVSVQPQIDAALAKAKAAWSKEEAARLAAAQEKWRTDAAATIARANARAEAAESRLGQDGPSAPPPPPADDQPFTDDLRKQVEELRKSLADREVELAQARLTIDARRLGAEPKAKFIPEPRTTERGVASAAGRSSKGMVRELVLVFAVVAAVIFGFPFVVPYLPYEWQLSVYQFQTSLFGAPHAAPAAAAPVAAPRPAPAAEQFTLLRAANIRKSPSANAAVVARLKRGESVTASEVQGNWTHVKSGDADGWVFSSYLKK